MSLQILIPFQPLEQDSPKPQLSNLQIEASSGTSASETPAEIWHVVFDQLAGNTLALKNARLVCRSWARGATQSLFSTAYLDAHLPSWSKLEELCQSPYAKYVKTIHWSPLVLYEDCLNADVWRYNYPNILRGTSHALLVPLHKAYRKAYRSSRKLGIQPSHTSRFVQLLPRLSNCRKFVLADDLDFESRCADGVTSQRLHDDTMLWDTIRMWAKSPRVPWKQPANQEKASIMWLLLALSKRLHHVIRLDIDLWESTFAEIWAMYDVREFRSSRLSFSSLHMRLKSCRMDVDEDDWSELFGISNALSSAFGGHFPSLLANLQEISIGTTYTSPGTYFVDQFEKLRREREAMEQEEEEEEATEDDTPEVTKIATQFSDLEERYECHRPDGFTRAMVSAYYHKFHFRFLPTTKLSEITLSNVLIDLRSLVYWLVDMHELPRKPFELVFSGHMFLYGLDKRVFHATLSALKVNLRYPTDTTFYYRGFPSLYESAYFDLGDDMIHKSTRHVLRAWPTLDTDKIIDERPTLLFSEMKDVPSEIEDARTHVDFKSRPQEWKAIKERTIATAIETKTNISFFYEYSESMSTDKYGNEHRWIAYEWIDQSTHDKRKGGEPPIRTLTQLEVCAFNRYDDYY